MAGKSSKAGSSLSEQVHQQTLDYFREAEKSSHPEIRALALKLAEETSKHHRKQSARVSPNLILLVNVVLGIGVILACWYAFLYHQGWLAYELAGVSILVYLVILAVFLLVPGYLSQTNFMKVVNALISHVKGWGKFKKEEKNHPEG